MIQQNFKQKNIFPLGWTEKINQSTNIDYFVSDEPFREAFDQSTENNDICESLRSTKREICHPNSYRKNGKFKPGRIPECGFPNE